MASWLFLGTPCTTCAVLCGTSNSRPRKSAVYEYLHTTMNEIVARPELVDLADEVPNQG